MNAMKVHSVVLVSAFLFSCGESRQATDQGDSLADAAADAVDRSNQGANSGGSNGAHQSVPSEAGAGIGTNGSGSGAGSIHHTESDGGGVSVGGSAGVASGSGGIGGSLNIRADAGPRGGSMGASGGPGSTTVGSGGSVGADAGPEGSTSSAHTGGADAGGADAGGADGGADAGSLACEPEGYCRDESGATVGQCGSECGGIGLRACPNSSLTCLTSKPSMVNDGPIQVCVARRAVQCGAPADCACLPGDCTLWGGAVAGPFYWTCNTGVCEGHCI